jgi:hypothetical protein
MRTHPGRYEQAALAASDIEEGNMLYVTLKDSDSYALVNPDYILLVLPKAWGCDILMTDDSTVQAAEDVETVADLLEGRATWEEEDDEMVRVSGVPYSVPARSVGGGHPRGLGTSSGPKTLSDQTETE